MAHIISVIWPWLRNPCDLVICFPDAYGPLDLQIFWLIPGAAPDFWASGLFFFYWQSLQAFGFVFPGPAPSLPASRPPDLVWSGSGPLDFCFCVPLYLQTFLFPYGLGAAPDLQTSRPPDLFLLDLQTSGLPDLWSGSRPPDFFYFFLGTTAALDLQTSGLPDLWSCAGPLDLFFWALL